MSAKQQKSWLFVAEWYDPMPQLRKKYLLKYFVGQHQVEMVDLKSKKMFLKKSACPPESTSADYFIGAKVYLYGRELDIVDFGDSFTRSELMQQAEKSIVIAPIDCYNYWGKILDEINQSLVVSNVVSVSLAPNVADDVCSELGESNRVSSSLSKGTCMVITTQGENGVEVLENVCLEICKRDRIAMYWTKNGSQVSALYTDVLKQNFRSNTASLDSCTCCIVKPHAVKARHVGRIMDIIIEQGYDISAITTIQFDRASSEEFLEVYKGVVPEFVDHTVQLSSGLSIAFEIRAENAVDTFRMTAGPWDVEIAKDIRPQTIRAQFGTDRIYSAIHCTDLASDGASECEYCFGLMTSVAASPAML